jgi:hypothetical protein
MFTGLTFKMMARVAFYVERANREDRKTAFPVSDHEVRQSVLHAR